MGQQEEKMKWRTLLSSMTSKVHNFWVLQNFSQAHLKRWTELKTQGTFGLKFLQPIKFNYELPYFLNYIKKLNSSLCGPFSLYPTSKGCQVKRPAFQGWAMALEKCKAGLSVQTLLECVFRGLGLVYLTPYLSCPARHQGPARPVR